ncbi:ATP-binding protein [Metamycoplasma faucium]|uniref:ATP-binding protein n=1 Tax=Metamycoplasma faucium TaxID=56142 RepID=A0ABZ2TLT3_9BACT
MEIVRNRYLSKLISKMNNGLVKIITGIRRCGKSYLLNQIFYRYLIKIGINKDHIIMISLDELENEYLLDAYKLNEYVKSKIIDDDKYYVFIDEIQEVQDFVKVLNGWLKISNLDIYVTGSNSKFLSNDIITEFRGRGDQIHVFPLSFYEFYKGLKLDFNEAFKLFTVYGGMPFVALQKNELDKMEYLSNLYNEIYLKDIKERYKIKNDSNLMELLAILASNIGSLTNSYKLSNSFKSKNINISKNTLDLYLKILEDSFLINKSTRYDIKGKKYITTPYKYYFSDIGLRNARLGFRQIEENHIMENIIYNELIYRGFSVDIGVVEISEKNNNGFFVRKSIEIDFIVNKGNSKVYIQSSYHLPTDEKLKQEIRPFLNTKDFFKKIIIVHDDIKRKKDENGIITMSIKDFLLFEDLLWKE